MAAADTFSGQGSHQDKTFGSIAWLLLAAALPIGVATFLVRHHELAAALYGFSPASLLHPTSLLPNFTGDFPSGEASILRSAVGQIYYVLGGLFRGQDDLIIWLMVATEALVLVAAVAYLCRRLSPNLPFWTTLGGGVLLASGTIASADLARWFHPFYGNVYNFSYAAGFVSIAATLDKRMLLAGLAIGVAGAFHPIIALFFGLAASTIVLVRPRDYNLVSLIGGAVVAAIVFAGWYLAAISDARISAGVDGVLFTDLTRLMSSHWFPVPMGVFGSRSWETLLPALALLLLLAATARTSGIDMRRTDRQMLAAIAALIVITLCGVAISMVSSSPILIKLALHRASLVALLLAAAVATPRLLQLAVSAPLPLALVAGGVLLTPYWRGHGVPLAAAFVFTASTIFFLRAELGRFDRIVILVTSLVSVAICAALALSAHGLALLIDTASGLSLLQSPWFGLAGLLILAGRLLKAAPLTAAAMSVGLWVWLPQVDLMADSELRDRAAQFQQAQLWAKANTEPASLFMLDPTMSYGWRQFSERPSFGVLREWLYSGWLYDTDAARMAEGLRRAKLLGLDLPTYTEMAKSNSTRAYDLLVADSARLFYSKDGGTLSAIARDNGVNYILLDKAKAGARLPQLPVAYENAAFVIFTP